MDVSLTPAGPQEVSLQDQANIGDVFDFFYTVKGWGKQGQIESLVRKLDEDQRWKVDEYEFDPETSKLRIRVEIVQNPFPVIIVIAAIGAIGTGLFCWLSLDSVEKIVSKPIGGLAMLGVIATGLMALKRFA
jgi:hypothetical protein